MRLVLLLVLPLTGCLYVGWDDLPNAKIRPEVHAAYLDNASFDNQAYWTNEVAAAIAIWNEAAVGAGCDAPFSISDELSAHPVRLLPRNVWPHEHPIIGMYVDEYSDDDSVGYIEIRERRPAHPSHLPVLLHELGHAIGLTHDDAPNTVMYEGPLSFGSLQARDVARMRDALGC